MKNKPRDRQLIGAVEFDGLQVTPHVTDKGWQPADLSATGKAA